MKKIGKIYRSAVLFLSLFAWSLPALAQKGPSIEATVSQSKLPVGGRLKLDVSVSGNFSDVQRPALPDFTGLQLLNATPSTSRSVSYINGVSKSSYTYSYYLQTKSAGMFQIPAIKIRVDGKDYQTDPIKITVQSGGNKSGSAATPDDNNKIFLKLNVSNHHPMEGEQLVADVILYFKQGMEVRSYQPVPGWKAQGFWKESLDNDSNPQINSTVINGMRYRSARLMQLALFPTKSGKLTISPYEISLSVRSSSRGNDPFGSFFGGFGSDQRQIKLKTNPVTLQVDSLPAPPEGHYIGAVGTFKINRKINHTKVETGESIEVTTSIRGTGNVPLINKPDYRFPAGLEVYQPDEKSNINRNNHHISGKKTYTEVAVARTPGTYVIPATTLAYFNPRTKNYITKKLAARQIHVRRNSDAVAAEPSSTILSMKPITGLASWVTPTAQSLYAHWWLWAGILFPLIIFGLAYWQKTYRDRMMTDRNFARSQKASDVAAERLKKALAFGENEQIKEAYNALQKALTGFISDRLGLPEAGLSIEQYVAELKAQNVDPELIKNVRMLLNKCATINYAPDSSKDYLKSHVGLAESIIGKLKKAL